MMRIWLFLCLVYTPIYARKLNVEPRFGKSGSLIVNYYLTSGADVHYVIVPSEQNIILEAGAIKEMVQNNLMNLKKDDDNDHLIQAGTLLFSEAQQVTFEVDTLESGKSYDTYLVAEVTGSNGVFGNVAIMLNVLTFPSPPVIQEMVWMPQNGTCTGAQLGLHVDGAGYVQYAVCDQVVDLVDGATFNETYAASFCPLVGRSLVDSETPLDITVATLSMDTKYYVWVRSESSTGTVVNELQELSMVTHAMPPNITSLVINPTAGSTTSAQAHLTLAPSADRSVEVHYTLSTPGEEREKVSQPLSNCTQEGENVYGFVVESLFANTSYVLDLYLETAQSFGVVGPPRSVTLDTHAEAPIALALNASAVLGSMESVHLSGNVSHYPAHVHYLLSNTSVRVKDIQEHPEWFTVIDVTTPSFSIDITDLEHSTTYQAWIQIESWQSGGVIGELNGPATPALTSVTHEPASTFTLQSLLPRDGNATVIDAKLSLFRPSLVLYAVKNVMGETVLGNMSCTVECTLPLENLEPGTVYDISLWTMTSHEVMGEKEETLNVKTHALPKKALISEFKPVNGETNTMELIVDTEGSVVVHSILIPTASLEDIDLIDTLSACALSQNDKSCAKNQASFVSHTVLDMGRISILHDALQSNMSYTALVLAETPFSNGVVSASAYESKDAWVSTTHAIAPKILHVLASAGNATTDSVVVQVEMDRCGPVHMEVSDMDVVDPSRIASATSLGHIATVTHTVQLISTFNGTCKGVVSLNKLNSDTIYHVQLWSETDKSFGVFGPKRAVPLVVRTHALPPVVEMLSLRPVKLKEDLEWNMNLNTHGVVHYVLLLRSTNGSQVNTTERPWRLPSLMESSFITASVLQNASDNSDFLGEGVAYNATVSVSREDIRSGKQKWNTLDTKHLLSGASYELCLVTETSDSVGVFGPVLCRTTSTWVDFTTIQNTWDAVTLSPVSLSSTQLDLSVTLPTLYHLTAIKSLGGEEEVTIEGLTGRRPHFVVLSQANGPASKSDWIIDAKVGQSQVVGTGILDHIQELNESFVTVGTRIHFLQPNTDYSVHLTSQSVWGENKNGMLTPPSANLTRVARTHAEPPRIMNVEVTATGGNASHFTVGMELEAQTSRDTAWVHIEVYDSNCLETCDPVAAFRRMYNYSMAAVGQKKKMEWVLSGESVNDEDSAGTLASDTLYGLRFATESVDSGGIHAVWSSASDVLVRTNPTAPDFTTLLIHPRRASTSELEIVWQLPTQGTVHVVLAKSGDINATCSTSQHIFRNSYFYSSQNKEDACSDIKTVTHRTFDASEMDQRVQIETLTHLSPNTSYDLFIVTESWPKTKVLSPVHATYNISTFATAPLVLSHAAYPTPGTSDELTLEYSIKTSGVLHVLVVQESDSSVVRQVSHEGYGEHHIILPVPTANTSYALNLVTETEGSMGVYGTVITIPAIKSHAEPPLMTSTFSLAASDGRNDALTFSACTQAAGSIYFILLSEKEKMVTKVSGEMPNVSLPGYHGLLSVNDTAPYCGSVQIEELQPSTNYALYVATRSPGNVSSTLEDVGRMGRTHGFAPRLLEAVDCSHAPDCKALEREPCWDTVHTCGNCMEDRVGTEGSSNDACMVAEEVAAPVEDVDPIEVDDDVATDEGVLTETAAAEAVEANDASPIDAVAASEAAAATEEVSVETDAVSEDKVDEDAEVQHNDLTTPSTNETMTDSSCPPNTHSIGSQCVCNDGYSLSSDGTSCEGIFHEEQVGNCPMHSSAMSPGHCVCNQGFQLNAYSTACVSMISA